MLAFNTKQFDWNGKTRIFSAEASELQIKPAFVGDAPVPVVIGLQSHITNRVESFELEEIWEDGTLQFKSQNPDLAVVKSHKSSQTWGNKPVRVIIFND
jgi:hypothetical protein